MLKRTNLVKKHYHTAFILSDGSGETSLDNKHSHLIVKDEQTGEFVVQESDKHTHKIEDITIKEVKDIDLTEEEELDVCYGVFYHTKNIDSENQLNAEEDNAMYNGDQWSKVDAQKLKEKNRPMITINELKSKIDFLGGFFRQSRTDIKVLPVEGSDSEAVDLYNFVMKLELRNQNYEYKEAEVFDDEARIGRGVMRLDIDYTENPLGKIKVNKVEFDRVFFGEHLEKDGSDCECVSAFTYLSKNKLKGMFPDKAEEINDDYDLIKQGLTDSEVVKRANRYPTKGQEFRLEDLYAAKDSDLVNINTQKYKMIETQRIIFKNIPVFFNAKDDFYFNASGLDREDIKKTKTIKSLSFANKVNRKVRINIFASNVMLYSGWSELNEINIIPFYANKYKNTWWGKVKDAKEPQRELNKRHSQLMDIINRNAHYAIGVTSDAFESTKDYNEFTKGFGTPGFIPKFKAGFKDHIYEFQGVKFPNEIVASSQLNSEKINTVMNIYPEQIGAPSKLESGVAIAAKQRAGLVGNEYLFDNFSYSKKRFGKLLLKAIQNVYTPNKILRIYEQNNGKNVEDVKDLFPELSLEEKMALAIKFGAMTEQDAAAFMQTMQQGGVIEGTALKILIDSMQQVFIEHKKQNIIDILSNKDLELDVQVVEDTYSPTNMLSNFVLLKDLAQQGYPIPPTQLIKLMPGLNTSIKSDIIKNIDAMEQQKAQAEQQKSQSEIQKAQIASEGKTQQAIINAQAKANSSSATRKTGNTSQSPVV